MADRQWGILITAPNGAKTAISVGAEAGDAVLLDYIRTALVHIRENDPEPLPDHDGPALTQPLRAPK